MVRKLHFDRITNCHTLTPVGVCIDVIYLCKTKYGHNLSQIKQISLRLNHPPFLFFHQYQKYAVKQPKLETQNTGYEHKCDANTQQQLNKLATSSAPTVHSNTTATTTTSKQSDAENKFMSSAKHTVNIFWFAFSDKVMQGDGGCLLTEFVCRCGCWVSNPEEQQFDNAFSFCPLPYPSL